jgi:hypothetical protein
LIHSLDYTVVLKLKMKQRTLFPLWTALFGLFLGYSLSSSRSSTLSTLSSSLPPRTVEEARKNLATALVHAWDLDRDKDLWSNQRGGVSAPRTLLNKFIQELAQQLGKNSNIGPACLDWDFKYMRRFPACTEPYDYQYSNSKERKFRQALKGTDIRKIAHNKSLSGLKLRRSRRGHGACSGKPVGFCHSDASL